jgi:HAD superfamily hydrolase (TIGR01509 family)
LIDETDPVRGARDLIASLKQRGLEVVLASSAVEKHVDAFLEKLDAHELTDAWTTKDDVESSKPDPDLVHAALAKAGSRDAVMVGDTPWDVAAAKKAGLETICVVTGGFSEDELRDAGAVAVYESVEELARRLGETALAR